ncbi:uncharacterized protein MELLADRAFT_90649 [Melampsora larici-populina 98AG31]|uniref:tRNA (guanine(9)-N1)-methyltransferase n=1 Tax=Melampsora larici-populina (strain 98AG31 / pathotype 3-4-7) TaxID=747676 RepID=F4RXN5_MELLP|nr:uncharacterized protein MELLADRAFT_90649 [Melampsora larici-populina 98AG31]EGG02758.1 hypothetical protein MELLADRAFT_90649 [Melampsora larici-populina 98AG31]
MKSKLKSNENEDEENQIKPKKSYQLQTVFDAKIIFDCEFDELMTLKETVSLNSQLSYSYSANRKSQVRFETLICTSFNGKLKERMQSNGNQQIRWSNFSFFSQSLEELINHPDQPVHSNQEEIIPTENQNQTSNLSFQKENIVYLTADSPNLITTLDPSKHYVIGAIVDHNRYKNLCYEKAERLGIHHAQLPIGEYMKELKSRKVLTVNQVLEILLNWISNHDWRKSFELVIPQRKFQL